MPERWEEELARLDRLEPSPDVHARVGQESFPQSVPLRREPPARRAIVIVTSFAIFLAAGGFAWRALTPTSQIPPAGPRSDDVPDVARIVCTSAGTEVSPVVQVADAGVHVRVENRSGDDEVLIQGVSGESVQHRADMELSSSTAHTFDQLPPGDYVVGCFTDEALVGAGDGWASLPGMVPVQITDPNDTYVSPTLGCQDQGRTTDQVVTRSRTLMTEDLLRSHIGGIDPEDVIERTGYPATRLSESAEAVGLQYRLDRAGQTLASIRLSLFEREGFFGAIISMEACAQTGLRIGQPSST